MLFHHLTIVCAAILCAASGVSRCLGADSESRILFPRLTQAATRDKYGSETVGTFTYGGRFLCKSDKVMLVRFLDENLDAYIDGWVDASGVVELGDAVPYFTRRATENPYDDHALMCRGVANWELRKKEIAIQDIIRAIRLRPDALKYFVYASYLQRMGNYDSAARNYSKSLELAVRPTAIQYNEEVNGGSII
ncbi:MAG: hypothetical protein R3E01_08550 [Pirellulaceae bacterium]